MSTSIKVKLRKSLCDNKECYLYFQLIHNRKVKQVSTRFKICKSEWDEDLMELKIDTLNKKRRIYLTTIQYELDEELHKFRNLINILDLNGEYSLDELTHAYLNRYLSGSLFYYMEEYARKLFLTGQNKTASSYLCTLRSFKRFRKDRDTDFRYINYPLIKDYETYLKSNGVSMNTISYYMRILRATYNRAADMGLTEQKFPFKGVYTGTEKTVKRAIDNQTITRLKKLYLSGHPNLQVTRDLFLFSLYTRGMSFVDMTYLKKNDIKDGSIIYRRRKTRQLLHIRIEPCMLKIIKRYEDLTKDSPFLLPIFDPNNPRPIYIQHRNAIYRHNLLLKKISQMLCLKNPLTTYVARHTWATMAKHSNIPLPIISEGMGHNSERTTQIYLDSLDQTIIDNANRMILQLI